MDNSITLNSDSVLEKFKVATGLFAQSGLSVQRDKIIEGMILSELNRLDPNDIAKRFSQTVIETLLKVPDQIAEEQEDSLDESVSETSKGV